MIMSLVNTFAGIYLVVIALGCLRLSDALKCEAVGCRYCVTRRMQANCASYCAKCNEQGSAARITSAATDTSTNTPSDHENIKRSPQGGKCGSPPDYKPCMPLSKANEIFHDCCENLNIGPCIRLCHYDVTLNKAKHMFDNGICTVEMIPKYLYCASQGKDNMQCCSKMGVFSAGGDRCRKFCDSAGNRNTITTKDVSCASQLTKILTCHWSGLE
uniref:DB domain-containing protein n=1 Tax=Trichuris muris TaxID=70415 RepID=A0A5S6Q929_TRIMR